MKRMFFSFLITAAIPLFLAACSDKVTEVSKVVEVQHGPLSTVLSENDLPDCVKDNNGSFVFTEDKKNISVCYDQKWYVLNGKDGATTVVKDGTNGKNGANGANGKDGSNGEDGVSCSGVAFKSGDSTGFMIVCGSDTLGFILNGTDGKDGKGGLHGMTPGLAKKLVKRMKRGINSMAFYSPGTNFTSFSDDEFVSDWSLWLEPKNKDRLRKSDFKMIADKGFDHIRLEVRWDTHFIGDSSKCQIDPEYMKQVRWAVDNTVAAGMIAVVEDHYLIFTQKATQDNANGNGYSYEDISPCEKEIYRQMIEEFKDISPNSLVLELPNEPTTEPYISAQQWNNLVDSLIQVIHGVDPARVIIVGSRNFYNKDYMNELRLNDPNGLLMAGFHYYEPFGFTQGNCGAAKAPDDTCGKPVWKGTQNQKMDIFKDFEQVAAWSKAHGDMPIYLGEFGTNYFVKDTASVERWLATIVQTADYFGFATAVFCFDGGMYLYHFTTEKWVSYKLRALFNSKEAFAAPNRPDLDVIAKNTVVEDFGDDYPKSKLSSDLGLDFEWGFYNSCEGRTTCDTVVTTNEAGTRSEKATMASFKTTHGHFGNGLYMKHVVDLPENVSPFWAFNLNFSEAGDYVDLSKMEALSFWAKGQGKIRAVLFTAYSDSIAAKSSSPGWKAGFYGEFSLSDEWTRYVVWADALLPERYSSLDTVGGEWEKAKDRVYKIEFKNGDGVLRGVKTTIEWYLDDITIHGMELEDFE